jgi:hypothetical protein
MQLCVSLTATYTRRPAQRVLLRQASASKLVRRNVYQSPTSWHADESKSLNGLFLPVDW